MSNTIQPNWTRGSIETNRDFPDYFHAEKYESIGYGAHAHRNIEIYCVIKGTSLVSINDREYTLTEGQAVVINGMQIHSYENSEGTIVAFVLIGTRYLQLFNSIYPEKSLPEFLYDEKANDTLLRIIDSIAYKYDDFDPFESIGYTNLIIHNIVARYGVESTKKSNKRFIFSDIIQYIYDNYTEDLSLEALAQKFNYAPRSIGHMFNKYVKMDIRNFINSVRVEKVIEMNADPDNSGKTILTLASECGFKSPSSFYRAYNKNYKQNRTDLPPKVR